MATETNGPLAAWPVKNQRRHDFGTCWCGSNHGQLNCLKCGQHATRSRFIPTTDHARTVMEHRCGRRHRWVTDFPNPVQVVDLRHCHHIHPLTPVSSEAS